MHSESKHLCWVKPEVCVTLIREWNIYADYWTIAEFNLNLKIQIVL